MRFPPVGNGILDVHNQLINPGVRGENPKILILDECTNSLDIETEKQILNEVNFFKGTKTIIMITHRPSTLENCDYIYKIDKEGLKIK